MCTTNHRPAALSLALAAWVVAPPAFADDARTTTDARAPESAVPALTPPVLIEDPGAGYPARAIAEAVRAPVTVTVLLRVDANGDVTGAEVVEPAGHGFDDAAIDAAKRLHFQPARRGDVPIAARVRHVYSFDPPPATVRGRVTARDSGAPVAGAAVLTDTDAGRTVVMTGSDGSWSLGAIRAGHIHLSVRAGGFVDDAIDLDANPAEEERVDVRLAPARAATTEGAEPDREVQVRGERPVNDVTRRTLDERELARIPGTNGDALRAIETMPGIARPPLGAGVLVVRGSAPQDTQILLDGTPIPAIYHLGGVSSVVPTEMLGKIAFYPGNFGAEYGRAMGGIVDAGMRSPKSDRLHAMGQVDLIDARVMAEGPLGAGWSFAVAGRRSWVDAWIGLVGQRGGTTVTTAPVYYDYQAVLENQLSPQSSLRIALFGSDDRVALTQTSARANDPAMSGTIGNHTGFWRLQVRYKKELSSGTSLALTTATGQDVVDSYIGSNFFRVTSVPITGRLDLGQRFGPGVKVNVGVDVAYEDNQVDVRFPPPPRDGAPPSGAVFTRPPLETKNSGGDARPGAYADAELQPWRGTRIVPGIRADYSQSTRKVDVAPRLNVRQDLRAAFPRTTVKGGLGLYYQPPDPTETDKVFGQSGLVSNRALHADFGAEQEITRQLGVFLEGFYKKLDRLVVPGQQNSGDGDVIGLEMLVRYQPDEHFFGWIAYTLSRSERRDSPSDPYRLFVLDQTHILTALGSYRIGRGWEIGARFRLVSGTLYTPSAYGSYDETTGAYLPSNLSPPNSARMPLFHQLDIRVDKTWTFHAWKLGTYLDLQNVYDHAAAEAPIYNFNYTQQSFQKGLPILPSLGVRGEL